MNNCFKCDECTYICEGDYLCSQTDQIVAEDHLPNENYGNCEGEE